MAEKKKSGSTAKNKKPSKAKAPSLNERITDFSVSPGKVTWVPKKKK